MPKPYGSYLSEIRSPYSRYSADLARLYRTRVELDKARKKLEAALDTAQGRKPVAVATSSKKEVQEEQKNDDRPILQKAANVHLKRFGIGFGVVAGIVAIAAAGYGIYVLYALFTTQFMIALGIIFGLLVIYWIGYVFTKPASKNRPDIGWY